MVKTFEHQDGRRIVVYPDRKIRLNYTTRDRGLGCPLRDEWPVLWRINVPALTDDQWYAVPVELGWKEVPTDDNHDQDRNR